MRIFCKMGLHRWFARSTARPGTSVLRCRRCHKRVVKHARPYLARRGRPSHE